MSTRQRIAVIGAFVVVLAIGVMLASMAANPRTTSWDWAAHGLVAAACIGLVVMVAMRFRVIGDPVFGEPSRRLWLALVVLLVCALAGAWLVLLGPQSNA